MFVKEDENKNNLPGLTRIVEAVQNSPDGKVSVFSDEAKEYESLRYGVGVRFYKPSYFRLSGKDALGFLQKLVSRDISAIGENEKISALFLNERGKILDRVRIFKDGEDFVVVGHKVYEEKLSLWMQRYLHGEDVEIISSDDYIVAELLGMQSESFAILIADEEGAKSNLITRQTTENLDFLFIREKSIWETPRFRALVKTDKLKEFAEYLTENKSVFNFDFVGESAFEVFRVESGLPKAPNEINDLLSPRELNLLKEIDSAKQGFLGKEAALNKDSYGTIERKLSLVIFDGEPEVELPFEIKIKDVEIGIVTSLVFSKYVNSFVGLGVFNSSIVDANIPRLDVEAGGKNCGISLQIPPLKR